MPASNTVTNNNHAPVSQVWDNNSIYSQEIPVLMYNNRAEGNEGKYITSPGGESLGSNVHAGRLECIRNSPQRYDPGFGAEIYWKSFNVASLVYMILY